MLHLDDLRAQHESALAMAQRLLDLIDDYRPGRPSYPILMQLNRLYGVLRLHLVQEDVVLYPALMASEHPDIRRLAQQFVDEMGGLALELECFARHWSCSASIAANFDEFSEATRAKMLELAIRIEREDQQLYPMLETAAPAISSRAA